jgi:CheY-like chemotaxis protein
MRQKRARRSGAEPGLGQQHVGRRSGMEPAISRSFGALYGDLRMRGLEAPPVTGRRRPLVVLAEPDDYIAELVSLVTEPNGYDIRHTPDGPEAWRLIRALEPDLLVVNRRLSGADGLALVHQVRACRDRAIAQMRLLVMDSYHGEDEILDAFQSGADDYLEMPCTIRTLLRCWRRVIAGVRRPAPLTALLNEEEAIRQVALTCLLNERPEGLVRGLEELLSYPDPEVRAMVEWALERLGTAEALAVLKSIQAA